MHEFLFTFNNYKIYFENKLSSLQRRDDEFLLSIKFWMERCVIVRFFLNETNSKSRKI